MKDVKAVQKERKKVNGQYTFVSHDAVSKALHDPLTHHGVMVLPNVAEIQQNGNRTSVRLDVRFVNIDDPRDAFDVSYWGYGIDTQDKGIGKAVSYAYKYCLLKTFCLETGDDVEADLIEYSEKDPAVPKIDPVLTMDQLKEIASFPEESRKKILDKLRESNGTTDFSQAKQSWFKRIIKALKEMENGTGN